MTANALASIEADLDRLERQRLGYALALASSQDAKTRARHERTLQRLDEEIGALQGAAVSLADCPVVSEVAHGVPVVDRTAEFTREEYDEVVEGSQRRWIWPALAAGLVALVGGTMWWLAQTPEPAKPVPTVAPASVIVTSPVPPDSQR